MRSILVGLGAGFLVGMFWAPRAGRETRRALAEAFGSGTTPTQSAGSRKRRKAPAMRENASFLAIVNGWSQEQLVEVSGIGPVLADKIIQNRPYRSEDAFLEAKLVPPVALEGLRKAS